MCLTQAHGRAEFFSFPARVHHMLKVDDRDIDLRPLPMGGIAFTPLQSVDLSIAAIAFVLIDPRMSQCGKLLKDLFE